MKQLKAPVAALLAALALAGCGAHPAGVSVNPAASTNRTTTAAPLRSQGVGATATVPQLLAFMKAAQTATQGFTATVDTDDKGPSGEEQDELKVAYKKPGTLHLNMVKATGQAQDASIVWTGGAELQIKLKVGFLPITTSLGLDDSRVKSRNGWTLKQTETNAIYQVIFDPAAHIQVLGQQPGDPGQTLTTIEVKSALSPKPADHEVIGVDIATGLPALRVLYNGTNRLYRLAVHNMKVGAPSSTEMAI